MAFSPNDVVVASVVYKKLQDGDPISDKQLVTALNIWTDIRLVLSASGATFYLAHVEVNRITNRLQDFKNARAQRRKCPPIGPKPDWVTP